jgi:DNA-binding transcriptional LysR family regulator
MGELTEAVKTGNLDLALVFEPPGVSTDGDAIANLPICWIGRRGDTWLNNDTLRIVAFDGACCFNRAAENALERTERRWRRTFTSASLASQWAAIRAGLGVGVRTEIGLPSDLAPIAKASALPDLGTIELRLLRRSGALGRPVKDLEALLVAGRGTFGGSGLMKVA